MKNQVIGCVIMASGQGKRFGSNKLMHEWNHKPLISYVLETVLYISDLSPVVVTNHTTVSNYCINENIPVVLHELKDRNETVKLGLQYLLSKHNNSLMGCMFCAADQPLVSADSIQNLISNFIAYPDSIHRLSFQDSPGNPVIFNRSYFDSLLSLPPKMGGNYLIKQNPEQVFYTPVQDSFELFDIDTVDDLEQIQNHFTSNS